MRDQGRSLFRLARAILPQDADAEDAVQEALLRAWRARGGFRGEASASTWLRTVVHNVAVERRRGVRELPYEDADALWADDAYTVDAERVLQRAETVRSIEDALIHVPTGARAAVLLHDVEGLSVPEIARVQGIGVEAAKQRLRRGRMALVTALDRDERVRRALRNVPMRCWDARRFVSEYMDGGLEAATRSALERHLSTCPTCPPLYTALVGVRAALGELRDSDTVVPPQLAVRLAAFAKDAGTHPD